MCFKKPKLPPKSAEDIQTEEDLKAMRIAQQREIARGITMEKDAQTEAAYARLLGMTGNRSLITGPKGGAGYIGANSGRATGRPMINRAPGAPIAPAVTPTPAAVAAAVTPAVWSGWTGGNIYMAGAQVGGSLTNRGSLLER